MSSSSGQSKRERVDGQPDRTNFMSGQLSVLRWRVWPAVDHWYVGLLAAMLWIVTLWQVQLATGKPYLVALIGLFLMGTMSKLFLPVTYQLDPDGMHRWFLGLHRFSPWGNICRMQVESRGVLLLASADRYPVEAVRGLYLPWGTNRPNELLDLLQHYIPPESDGE